jgi:hypothetical protein
MKLRTIIPLTQVMGQNYDTFSRVFDICHETGLIVHSCMGNDYFTHASLFNFNTGEKIAVIYNIHPIEQKTVRIESIHINSKLGIIVVAYPLYIGFYTLDGIFLKFFNTDSDGDGLHFVQFVSHDDTKNQSIYLVLDNDGPEGNPWYILCIDSKLNITKIIFDYKQEVKDSLSYVRLCTMGEVEDEYDLYSSVNAKLIMSTIIKNKFSLTQWNWHSYYNSIIENKEVFLDHFLAPSSHFNYTKRSKKRTFEPLTSSAEIYLISQSQDKSTIYCRKYKLGSYEPIFVGLFVFESYLWENYIDFKVCRVPQAGNDFFSSWSSEKVSIFF